jgi:hypothetical protein
METITFRFEAARAVIAELISWKERHEFDTFIVVHNEQHSCKITVSDTKIVVDIRGTYLCEYEVPGQDMLQTKTETLSRRIQWAYDEAQRFFNRLELCHTCRLQLTEKHPCSTCEADLLTTINTQEECVGCREAGKPIVFKCQCSGSAMCAHCTRVWLSTQANQRDMKCFVCKGTNKVVFNLVPNLTKQKGWTRYECWQSFDAEEEKKDEAEKQAALEPREPPQKRPKRHFTRSQRTTE